jgi:AraC-like DNA-binding protein
VTFKEILPDQKLQPYIKGFYFYESNSGVSFDDIVFPSGNMEVIFNLGEGLWQTGKDGHFYTTPPIELWGQITKPLAIKSSGKNIMLGIRFYPYSAAYFFKENAAEFNNDISDAADLFGPSIRTLHARLLETTDLNNRISLVEAYLLNRLTISDKKHSKIKFIGEIADSLKNDCTNEKIVSISIRNNISTRYLNQLFSQYTGLAPKLFCKIHRFQYSLNLLHASNQKLTGIAYDAGYFDQSHFIREFKLFTGITPTSFATQALPINQILVTN